VLHEVTIPALGIAMEEATLTAWLKQEGDDVDLDEPIAEIETDKTTMELVAPTRGTLGAHRFEPGTFIPVGAVVTVVYAIDEQDHESVASMEDAVAVPQPVESEPHIRSEQIPAREAPEGVDSRRPHRKSPRARAIERARGHAASSEGDVAADSFREIIARRVSESWQTIPHFSVTREIDVEELRTALAAVRERVPTANVTDLLIRAHALAMVTEEAVQVDIGLAVASERGVVVPVIRDVLGLGLEELAAERLGATHRGRAGRLMAEDSVIPTSTLSNLGPFGADSFTGVIGVCQTTLLTIGRIRSALRPVDEAAAVRHVMTATLNADHRSLDGAEAARLLTAVAASLEAPDRLVQEGCLVSD
jgi:pyruvate dehydrogenase E2 component (dihydrolipoamide acetyltransferase)